MKTKPAARGKKGGKSVAEKRSIRPDKKPKKKGTGKKEEKAGDPSLLSVQRQESVDLKEVSGICLQRGGKGRMSLMAISDKEAWLAWTLLPDHVSGKLHWGCINLSKLPGSKLPFKNPQIEAICADGAGRVLLLQEWPARAELIDPAPGNQCVVASIKLSVGKLGETFVRLAESWEHPEGSRGEGAVLLPGGHLLVAKEKKPAALIEFGPAGSKSRGLPYDGALADGERWAVEGKHKFVALAVWWPDDGLLEACEDFSDLEIGPDGRLYLLSDQSKAIAQLDALPSGGGVVSATAVWKLGDLDGKPEGLAFTPKGHAIVALDKGKTKNNLMLMKPAIAGA